MELEWKAINAWAPIVGRWVFEPSRAIYQRPQGNAEAPPIGIALSDQDFAEGAVKTTILFAGPELSGQILLGYRGPNERYLVAGLGGYGFAYSLSEFEPGYGWRGLVLSGSEANLTTGVPYVVEVQLQGQRLFLEVNGVRIFEHILQHPLAGGQTGLFAWSRSEVTFSDTQIAKLPPKIFVVMQFSEPYKQLYSEVIQPVAKAFHLLAYHAGEIFGPGVILHDIAQGIIEAKIVIAEVTPANQNVFYELGYAHALGKPTILLAEKGKQLPFDISSYRCLFYENTIGGKKLVEEGLRKHLQAILRQ